ncbi:MAG: hypothetical protein ACRC41_10885 [Sarcina sp.]
MEIKGKMSLSDYSNIHDYMGIIEVKDKFLISAKSLEKEEINIICSMLKELNFNINNRNFDNNGDCYIEAQKIS